MPIKVVITSLDHGQDYNEYISELGKSGYDVTWTPVRNYSPEETVRVTKGYEVIMAGGEKYDRWALGQLRDTLKVLLRHGTGTDNIDITAATDLGIAVTYAPGRNARAVAEHCLGMMIGLTRKFVFYDREVRRGNWTIGISSELYGKTVGIIGFGSVGKWLARLLKGFDCRMLAFDKQFDWASAEMLGAEQAEISEILHESDFISLQLPLTSQTAGSIGYDFFKQMKRTAFFLNTSRGKIVLEDDLVRALQEGIIAGAGLDVFSDPPLATNHPLRAMENVVLSPHTSAVTYESMKDMMDCCITDMNKFFSGETPINLLNPGYEVNRR